MSLFDRPNTGGAEIFNKALFEGLLKNGFPVSKPDGSCEGPLNRQRLKIFFQVLKNKDKMVLANHSAFLDIILIFLLTIAGKKVYTISHVGPGYRHMDNIISISFVRFVLKKIVAKSFMLTATQRDWVHGSSTKGIIIPTIIRDEFFNQEKSKISTHSDYILYYGRVSADKGIGDLLKAFSKTKIKQLLIAGNFDNGYKEEFYSLIKSLHIDKKVEYVGAVYDTEKLISLIDFSKFVIYPSRYDLYPLVIFEVFLRDKLCISTYVAENESLYLSRDYLVKPGDINGLANLISRVDSVEATTIADFINQMKKQFLNLTATETAKVLISNFHDKN